MTARPRLDAWTVVHVPHWPGPGPRPESGPLAISRRTFPTAAAMRRALLGAWVPRRLWQDAERGTYAPAGDVWRWGPTDDVDLAGLDARVSRDDRARALARLPKSQLVALYRPYVLATAHPLTTWTKDDLVSSILAAEYPSPASPEVTE